MIIDHPVVVKQGLSHEAKNVNTSSYGIDGRNNWSLY